MIVSNSMQCFKCGVVVYSAHVHDYVTCRCGNVSVDGGDHYLKRSVRYETLARDLSIVLPDEVVYDIIHEAKTSRLSGRNDAGVAYAVIRALNKHDLLVKKD